MAADGYKADRYQGTVLASHVYAAGGGGPSLGYPGSESCSAGGGGTVVPVPESGSCSAGAYEEEGSVVSPFSCHTVGQISITRPSKCTKI